MAWSTPLTAVANAALTAAQWNASVRDNFLETAVAKAATAGGYPVSTGTNLLAERVIGFDSVAASQTTTSTSFTNLATVGPTVTSTTGVQCIGMHSAYLDNNTVSLSSLTAIEITGATSVSPTDNFALSMTSATANAHLRASWVMVYALTPGSNTFQMKYRVTGGTGAFNFRRLTIMPL